MSLFLALLLITLAWLGSGIVIDLTELWHLGQWIPRWLGWAMVVGALAWFGGK
jgi:hypothetical protein